LNSLGNVVDWSDVRGLKAVWVNRQRWPGRGTRKAKQQNTDGIVR